MDRLKIFLQSSSIHGLSYIPETRRFVRLFWIITVVAGRVDDKIFRKRKVDLIKD